MNWTKYWNEQRKKLKKIFEEKGIMLCEVRLDDNCWLNNGLSFAHRHKRIWYKKAGREYLLGDFRQVILACPYCHDKMEKSQSLTEEIFFKLR